MDAVALLSALREAAPHCTPSLTLDSRGALVMGLHDRGTGTNFTGTLEPDDHKLDVVALAGQMAEAERRAHE